MLSHRIHIRCLGFDANGLPRKSGCPKKHACRFTHPDDPGWPTAASPSASARAIYNRRRSPSPRPCPPPTPTSSSTAPPPSSSTSTAPPSSPTMSALPPLPTPPHALFKKPAPQKTHEQLRALWEERIKQVPHFCITSPFSPSFRALAESTARRQDLAKIEGDITSTRALISSLHYLSLPGDSKSRINDELAQLERKRDQVRKQREDAINQLINSDSWPATPLTDAQDRELDRYSEIKKSVADLKEQVESINTLFFKLSNGKDSPMDVDPPDASSSRPLKRRRGAESDIVPENEPGPTKEQLQAMQRKITELESAYSTFSNDLIVSDEVLQQRIEAEVELQLDKSPPPETAVFAHVTAEIKQNGDEIGTLASELAKLLLKADDQEKKLEDVKGRIATSQAQFQEMRSKFQKLQEEREKDHKTIAALEEAVKTYTEHPPQPAVPGLTHDQIIHLMDEPLLDIVRAHIRPLLEQLRDKVQDMLNMQNSEMYTVLWGKLSLTLRMVETISKRLERVDQGSASAAQNVA